MTPSWKLSHALRVVGGNRLWNSSWQVLEKKCSAVLSFEPLTEWHATQGGKIKEEMLELVPALRGRVRALGIIPDEYDKYVATYIVSVADFKSTKHAVCR